MIIVFPFLVPKGFRAITIWPFVFVAQARDVTDEQLIAHERIHLRQQIECVVLLFYVWYLAEFLIRLLQQRTRLKAYRALSMEREAYENEGNSQYLAQRKPFSFLRYL